MAVLRFCLTSLADGGIIVRETIGRINGVEDVMQKTKEANSLLEGPIAKGIIRFAIPVFLGQLLQQLYNLADAWVVGNFADNDAFAAVSSIGSMTFLIIGFFGGIAAGGGIVISRHFGAGDETKVEQAIHTNFLFGLLASVCATVLGLLLAPQILTLMKTPAEVMPHALSYLRIFFAGVSSLIMYNICMGIMRSLGDSVRPLYYLALSSAVNVVLDLLFVAVLQLGVAGAAIATVAAQTLSVVLCIVRMCKQKDYTRLDFRKIRFHGDMLRQVAHQGFPMGIQNSVISVGNMVIQSNINAFGAYAMSGYGAYARIEGFVFLPIMCMSMALPTFVSQNLGARQAARAKKGAMFGILFGMVLAELVGLLLFFGANYALRLFVDTEAALSYGTTHARTVSLFFCMLAFSHCAAGALRGCGKSFIPMLTMLVCWCGVRILYVTVFIQIYPVYRTIAWAYPLTWTLSAIVLLVCLLRVNWSKA